MPPSCFLIKHTVHFCSKSILEPFSGDQTTKKCFLGHSENVETDYLIGQSETEFQAVYLNLDEICESYF